MSTSAAIDWHPANQQHLSAAVAVVREDLERHANGGTRPGEGEGTARGVMEEASAAMPAPAALDSLAATFGLTPFERDLLVLCAGVELDSRFGALCAAARGDPARPFPTFGLALAALPGAHWSALSPDAPLRRWRLIDVGPGPLTQGSLGIDERILHHLVGIGCLDERLVGLVEPLPPSAELAPSHRALAGRVSAVLGGPTRRGDPVPVVQLCGGDPAARRDVAASGCGAVGLGALAVRGPSFPADSREMEPLARLCQREAMLSGAVLVVEVDEDGSGREGVLVRLVDRIAGPVVVTCAERMVVSHRQVVTLEVERPTSSEQRDLWREALGEAATSLDGRLDPLVSQFSLTPHAIRSASASALARRDDDDDLAVALWETCRSETRPGLGSLAQRLEIAATWDDLVLPAAQLEILREVAVHVRRRARVYDDWGFRSRSSRGLGITALFAGPSGTGKTMAAEVLASELRLDLYRIDLSQVVSKYIGETEKNLGRVFDAAEEGGGILLFDEADALFGKRTEVRDSHDRYANIEVGYLLQRMEAYRGLAVLTTNMKEALDPAFLRRLRFVVQFPFPDAGLRAEIWRRVFPVQTPTASLEVERLARLNLTGATIRNIALRAAFLAADAGEPVQMQHVLRGARSEYAKLERPMLELEVGSS